MGGFVRLQCSLVTQGVVAEHGFYRSVNDLISAVGFRWRTSAVEAERLKRLIDSAEDLRKAQSIRRLVVSVTEEAARENDAERIDMGRRQSQLAHYPVDFGTQDWYTQSARACNK